MKVTEDHSAVIKGNTLTCDQSQFGSQVTKISKKIIITKKKDKRSMLD